MAGISKRKDEMKADGKCQHRSDSFCQLSKIDRAREGVQL